MTRPKTSSHLNLPALCCDHPCPDGHIKLSPRGWLNPDVIALNEQDMNNTVFLYVVSYDLLFPSFIAVLVRRDKPMQSRPINEDEAAFERVAEGRIRARLVNFSLPQRVFHHSAPPPVITPTTINSPTLPLSMMDPFNQKTGEL